MNKRLTSGVILAVFMGSGSAFAQPQEASGWGAGLGAVIQQQGYVGASTDTMIFPMLSYQGENFYWQGPELGYEVNDNLSFFGSYRFDGFDEDDSNFFDGMEARKGSLDLGVAYSFDTDIGNIEVEAAFDVLDEHGGYELGLSYGFPLPALGGMVIPSIGVSYVSEDLVDYYYGVRASEATDNRPQYQGDSAVNFSVGLTGFWPIEENQQVFASLSYDILGSGIEDSPLLEDSASSSLVIGWIYQF